MSWLSSLFGKKIKAPALEPFEEFDYDTEWAKENELKKLARKSGFLSTLRTGRKKPKLAGSSYLGAR
jgi:TorA maturation chaperone TorD